MTNACMHVDYLSHNWTASDVIRAHLQTRKQVRKVSALLAASISNEKERRTLEKEQHRLARFQNALWREMARTCTDNLSRHNAMVHPSSVNWQKESDITWLYGPLYTSNHTTPSHEAMTQRDTSGLKPVLKKVTTRPDILGLHPPRRVGSPSVSDSDEGADRSASFSSTSTACTSTSTQTSSSTVRFSPEITKVQYFLPESPVRESFGACEQGWNPYFDEYAEDDDEEDDAVWLLAMDVFGYLKSNLITYMGFLMPSAWLSLAARPVRGVRRATTSLDVVVLFVSLTKSIVSLLVSWLIYHSLLRLSSLVPTSRCTAKTTVAKKAPLHQGSACI